MNLQERTVLVLLLTLIAVMSVLTIFVSAIYLSSFTGLEHEYVARDLNEAVSSLDNEAVTLSALVSDWGPWDDTYDFVNGNKPDYVGKNLVPETFNNIRVNLIIITDSKGRIVYSGAYDLLNNTMVAVPESLSGQLGLNSPLLRMTNPRSATTGILLLPENPLIFASRPIVHTDFSGTPQGVVIMGRYLDTGEMHRLGTLTTPSLNMSRADSPEFSPLLISGLKSAGGDVPEVIQPQSQDSIRGYALIHDVYGNDALVLSITQPRDIYAQGVRTTFEFIAVILISGLFLGIVILLFIDRFVLSRIGTLSGQIYEIGRGTGSLSRVEVRGDDELTGLAVEINHMLDTIEKTQQKVQASEIRFRELA
jgi:sensor domain CHASE-containing protein